MSRSNNTELTNPATRFFEWSGGQGVVKYWDKTKGEKGENVSLPLPFKFIVLDTLSTIVGFDNQSDSGYWSNEVRDTTTEILVVHNKKGVQARGVYQDIKASGDITGSKYAQSVYIAYLDGKTMKLGNIKFFGSALSPWIEFRKKNKVFEIAISIGDKEAKKNGSNDYFEPVFKANEIKPETDEVATKLDAELQEYLEKYLKNARQKADETVAETTSTETVKKESGRTAKQEEAEKATPETAAPKDVPLSEVDDLPF